MLTGISRYGVREVPGTERIIQRRRRRKELVRGPHIEQFEQAMAKYLGCCHAVSTSYGRMAFYYILKALDLPAGSEIVAPALTFWVIPEMARLAALKPVFADVNPATFNMCPLALERAITPRTRAIVPTHLYGLPCEMDSIMEIAQRHKLVVIEDCAHALGARYRGRLVGTFGDAAFFSFQSLKPLNTYGGGMAIVREPELARRVAALAHAEPWPDERCVLRQLRLGRLQRVLTRPSVFTFTGLPILWVCSWLKAQPDVYLWEKIRPLDPLPAGYRQRYTNVQAALGLEALTYLDAWTAKTQRHARLMDEALRDCPGVLTPQAPAESTHVYYQYCAYVPDRDELVRRSIRRGLDIETLHVDVCTRLPLFRDFWTDAPGADRAAEAVQLPVYAGLSDRQIRWVARQVGRALGEKNVSAPLASRAGPN